MRIIVLVFILSVLSGISCLGQYSYFSQFMLNPYPETGYGVGAHLFTKGDTLMALGIYPMPFEETWVVEKRTYFLSSSGEIIQELYSTNPNNGFMTLNYSGAIDNDQQGNYLIGCSFWDSSMPKEKARIVVLNQAFEDTFYFEIDGYEADSILRSEYTVAIELDDLTKLSAGRVQYDEEPGTAGGEYSVSLLTKFNQEGEIMWHKEFLVLFEPPSLTAPKHFRFGHLFEMPNGDIIAWGCHAFDWEPVVLRFDSAGNLLSHSTWGHQTLDDWLPFPVRTGEEEFVFGYTSAQYWSNAFSVTYVKPRAGRFNSATMEVELWEPFDHEMCIAYVTDAEQINSGEYVALGFGIKNVNGSPIEGQEVVYMLKFDDQGNEIWYHEYYPPLPHLNPDAWDLEVTSDGGLAFVGNFRHLISQNEPAPKYTWVVKTDACGDVVFNGCPPPIGVSEQTAKSSLMLYPNPAQTQLNIILPPGGNRAEVFDMRGQLVHSAFVYPGWDRTTVDVAGLSTGMYMVRVVKESGEVMGVGRFVK